MAQTVPEYALLRIFFKTHTELSSSDHHRSDSDMEPDRSLLHLILTSKVRMNMFCCLSSRSNEQHYRLFFAATWAGDRLQMLLRHQKITKSNAGMKNLMMMSTFTKPVFAAVCLY